ncbi:unnamed protein product [Linum tenue]|uniref:Uncharacterized protein n=1 Tax=Linum tenue TaxID=586396 RepID=A0AAV0RTN3_9ROSI|nr:unnamed protein product [Linum tenue]
MSRFVMDSNNLWLISITDGTIRVMEGAYSPDLNTHDVPRNPSDWKQAARIGSNAYCSHRELEVLGVVFTGGKVEELRSGISGRQMMVNREGFMVTWLNPGGGSIYLRPNSVLRRLNDLYEWSKHGVQVAVPVETAWDRFELTTGKLMVGAAGTGSAQKEIEELKKQAQEKDDQLAAKDKQIANLRNALSAFV